MKKILSILLAVLMLTALCAPALAAEEIVIEEAVLDGEFIVKADADPEDLPAGMEIREEPGAGAPEGPGDHEGLPVDEETFPDPNFQEYILAEIDTDGDGFLSEAEIAAVEVIDVTEKGIAEVTGIAVFPALRELFCAANSLTALDLSGNTKLRFLAINNTGITSIDLSSLTALEYLNCVKCGMTKLDLTAVRTPSGSLT